MKTPSPSESAVVIFPTADCHPLVAQDGKSEKIEEELLNQFLTAVNALFDVLTAIEKNLGSPSSGPLFRANVNRAGRENVQKSKLQAADANVRQVEKTDDAAEIEKKEENNEKRLCMKEKRQANDKPNGTEFIWDSKNANTLDTDFFNALSTSVSCSDFPLDFSSSPISTLGHYRNFMNCLHRITPHLEKPLFILKFLQLLFKHKISDLPVYCRLLVICMYMPGGEEDEFCKLLIRWWDTIEPEPPVSLPILSDPFTPEQQFLIDQESGDTLNGSPSGIFTHPGEGHSSLLRSLLTSFLPMVSWLYLSRTLLPAAHLHACHYYLKCCEIVELQLSNCSTSHSEERGNELFYETWGFLHQPETEVLPDNYLGIENLLSHFALTASKSEKQQLKLFNVSNFYTAYHDNRLLKETLIRGSKYVARLHSGVLHPLYSEKSMLTKFKRMDKSDKMLIEALEENEIPGEELADDVQENVFTSNQYFAKVTNETIDVMTSRSQMDVVMQCIALFHTYMDLFMESIRFAYHMDDNSTGDAMAVECRATIGWYFAKVARSLLSLTFEPAQPRLLVKEWSAPTASDFTKNGLYTMGDTETNDNKDREVAAVLSQFFDLAAAESFGEQKIDAKSFMTALHRFQQSKSSDIYELADMEVDPWRTGDIRLVFRERHLLTFCQPVGLLYSRLKAEYEMHLKLEQSRVVAAVTSPAISKALQSAAEAIAALKQAVKEGLLRAEIEAMPKAYWSFKVIESGLGCN